MKQLFTVFFLLITVTLFAQPANDDCGGIIDLGVAPSCDSTLYNNVGATESNIGFDNFPPCFLGNPDRDVWFQFEASDTIIDYLITVTGCPDPDNGFGAMLQPQIAIYRGDCEFDGLQLLDCVSADPGENIVEMQLVGLTLGLQYFIRINDWSSSAAPNEGAFKLCIVKKPPIDDICSGGSTLSSGTLTDSGGEDGDYSNNENCVYTICPTAPHECLNFNLEYYNIETTGPDALNFYDGPDTGSPLIASIDGTGVNTQLGANNGGVCYSVSASSGCMTVEFISDGEVTFEGFLGSWEISNDACQQNDPITVNTGISNEEIVQSLISGQTTITVTDINCPNGSLGTFSSNGNSDLGLSQGIIISNGLAAEAEGPNDGLASNDVGGGGDVFLDSLSAAYSPTFAAAQDACVIELDVFAATNELTFEYIFGSEEYPDQSPGIFTDIFALLAEGPGITPDPALASFSNYANVATLPDGTFIEISTVNPAINWQYYRDNIGGQSVNYDGLTSDFLGIKKSLTARVETEPCNTYHLRFSVADRTDGIFDSGVFIGEISGGSPNIGVTYNNGIQYLVEDCTPVPDEVTFTIDTELEQPTSYNIQIGGTAENGVDYELTIPSSITFNSGLEVFTFPIIALSDGIVEGTETIEISLSNDFGCGEVILTTLTIEIQDQLNVQIFEDELDTILVCGGTCAQIDASGGAEYFWQPPGVFDNPNIANPTVCPDSSFWVSVTGILGVCSDVDSAFVQLITPEIEVLPDPNVTICETDSITLTAVNNVNDANLTWQSFFVPFGDPSNPVQTIVPPPFFNTIFATVSVELGGCVASQDVNIIVDPFDFPEVANDTTICQNFSVDLGTDITNTTTSFNWTPDEFLEPTNLASGPVATPETTTTYQLIAESVSGVCHDTAEVTITVIPADVEFQNPDTTYICLGDTATLNAVNSTNGVGVTWTPTDFLDIISPEQALASPPVSTWYYNVLDATAECTVVDSVLVWVDSLPDLSIMAVPAKDSYCEGEEVTLVSPTYEPANFPDIDFTWQDPMPGSQTPDSFLNLVILAVEDNIFIRTTTVNACVSMDSIPIEVVEAVNISIVPALDTVCQGESIQFSIDGPPELTNFSWTPPGSLDDPSSATPTATPDQTTTYQVEAEFEGCPVGASATLVVPDVLFDGGDQFICQGDNALLNNINVPGAIYNWTSADGTFTSSEAQPVVSPTTTTTYNLVASFAECTVNASVTVTVVEPFSIEIQPVGEFCPGTTVELTFTSNPSDLNGYTITWTDGFGNQYSGQSITVPGNLVSSTFDVSLSVISPNGCFTETDNITVQVSPDFSVTATSDPATDIPEGSNVTLNAVTTGGSNFSFEWTDAEGMLIGANQSVVTAFCGNQTFTVVATDPNGCTKSDDIFIETIPGFDLIATAEPDSAVTAGSEVTLTAVPTGGNGLSYVWSNGQSGQSIVVTPCEPTLYSVTATDAIGCDQVADVFVGVTAGFTIESVLVWQNDTIQTEIYEGQEFQLIAITTPSPVPGADYQWVFNDSTFSINQDTISGVFNAPEVDVDTEFPFGVNIIDPSGCADSEFSNVLVLNNPVEMPNVFTPNSDGTNDFFLPVSKIPVTVVDFKIWNRWGQLVYENENPDTGWDGTQNGDPAASDVYIYQVVWEITGGNGMRVAEKGDVTLLR